MNKSAIQRFAIWARTELIEKVQQRAYQYGITKDGYGEQNAVTASGRALTTDEQRQRKELVDQIRSKGYTQVMEEVAYTWFNRFIALRFMEVNNYLPSHIRVFSDSTGAFKPEILNDVLHLDLPGLNTEKVAEYIEKNQTEDLYRYLLLTQCNALNASLPQMFERMGGFTELLLPNNILKQDSILGHMVTDIPEEDWTDQVQIIGWLYQYYNSELKDDTFALLKKNVKITKERIPSATQLFTPDWIVRYMVENSLGRIFIDKRKNEGAFADGRGVDEMTWEESEAKRIANEKIIAEQMGWKYYLPEAEQTEEVRQQLDEIQREYANLDVKEIKVIDPCMGSGHILVYAFDVLIQIYEANGYSQRDAAQSILENNLYGLDIDDRAAQLAYFAVMMKARQYDRRIFTRGIQPNVYSIVESNGLDSNTIDYFTNNDPKLKKDFETLVDELHDAKEYGSILNISQVDFAALHARVEEVRGDISLFKEMVLKDIEPLIRVAEIMAHKYDVAVTNPPYLGNGSVKLTEYLQKNYASEKYDLYAAFMRKGLSFLKPHGYEAMVTGESWMFLPSFADMRQSITRSQTILNMAHLGFGAFDGGFGTTAFVFAKTIIPSYSSSFVRLVGIKDAKDKSEQLSSALRKTIVFQQKDFEKIEGFPFAYWMNRNVLDSFKHSPLSQHAVTKAGIVTGNNDFFMKLWHEVLFTEIEFNAKCGDDLPKWVPAHKGGGNCRYYGNFDYVMRLNDLWNPGLATSNMRRGDQNYYFLEGLTWSTLSNKLAFRYSPSGFVYETKGSMCFAKENTSLFFMLGLLNSSLCDYVMSILSPTLDFNRGSLLKMPYVEDQNKMIHIEETVKECVELAKEDWDSFETSWDFQKHPLV